MPSTVNRRYFCGSATGALDYMDNHARLYAGLMREHLGDSSNYVRRVMEKALADLDT